MGEIRIQDFFYIPTTDAVFNFTMGLNKGKNNSMARSLQQQFKSFAEYVASTAKTLDEYLFVICGYIMRPIAAAIAFDNTALVSMVLEHSSKNFSPVGIIERNTLTVIEITDNATRQIPLSSSFSLQEYTPLDALVNNTNPEIVGMVLPHFGRLPLSYINKLIACGSKLPLASLNGSLKELYDFPALLSLFTRGEIVQMLTPAELDEKILGSADSGSWQAAFENAELASMLEGEFGEYLSAFTCDEARMEFAEKAMLILAAYCCPIPDCEYYGDEVDISQLPVSMGLVAADFISGKGVRPIYDIAHSRKRYVPEYNSGTELYTLITSFELKSDGGFDLFEKKVIENLSAARLKKAIKQGVFNSYNIREALRYSCELKAVEKTRVLLEFSRTLK